MLEERKRREKPYHLQLEEVMVDDLKESRLLEGSLHLVLRLGVVRLLYFKLVFCDKCVTKRVKCLMKKRGKD